MDQYDPPRLPRHLAHLTPTYPVLYSNTSHTRFPSGWMIRKPFCGQRDPILRYKETIPPPPPPPLPLPQNPFFRHLCCRTALIWVWRRNNFPFLTMSLACDKQWLFTPSFHITATTLPNIARQWPEHGCYGNGMTTLAARMGRAHGLFRMLIVWSQDRVTGPWWRQEGGNTQPR